MARYEFRCEDCGESFEVERSMSEHEREGPPACPECGSGDTRQLMSGFFPDTSDKS